MADAIKYLGIDYGKAKVGLAMAEDETRLAFPYGTLKNDKDFFQELVKIIKQEKISKVIIGIPAYINRKETEYDGEKLGEYLKNILGMEIEYHSEMFTTKMAQEKLKEKGVKNVKNLDDPEAAGIILQSWLDMLAIKK